MRTTLTRAQISSTLAAEVGAALGRRLGEQVRLSPAAHWGEASCIATVPVAGRARGIVSVWLDRDALAALTPASEPASEGGAQALVDFAAAVVSDAVSAAQTQPGLTTLAFGPVQVSMAQPGDQAPLLAVVVTLASGARCAVAVGADIDIQSDPEDERLEAVLDFDLPLIVRFGRSVMSLKALAALGPGAVVDLGRSPDQPVELVMAEKVIALGEVVVVGGNYGVRITELTGAKPFARMTPGGQS